MNQGFHLVTLFGINISINWSWIFIFILMFINLSIGFFPRLHPSWGPSITFPLSLLTSLLFFSSVIAHELAHSLVAKSHGIHVNQITLFIFGGVANIKREPNTPKSEFLIAIAGPLTSFVIGIVFLALSGLTTNFMFDSMSILTQMKPLPTMFLWVGTVNIILGIFNLTPGFPLDGGRVLRSVLWAITKDFRKATRYATWSGQGIGLFFIYMGIIMIFGIHLPIFGSGLFNGVWLTFIGWFLTNAATQSYERILIEKILEHVPVSRLIRTKVSTVSPNILISTLIYEHIIGSSDRAFPVVHKGKLEGLVSIEDVKKVKRELWNKTRVKQIMTPVHQLEVLSPNEGAGQALNKLVMRDVGQIPVVDNGILVGILRRKDIIKWVHTHTNRHSH